MNQNIQNWIIEQASNVTNWANAEVPLVIQEFLTWSFYNNLVNIAFCVLYLLAILVSILKFKKFLIKAANEYDNIPFIIVATITILISLICFPVLFNSTKECIQIKVAPRVFLVEKAAELIKQK
jgi:hypothetical protein